MNQMKNTISGEQSNQKNQLKAELMKIKGVKQTNELNQIKQINESNEHFKVITQIPQETIQRGNKFYIIKKTDDESRELYLSRVNYIIEKITSYPEMSFDNIERLSFIWRNMNFNKIKYPSSVLKQL